MRRFDGVDGSLVGSACFYHSSQEKNYTGEEVRQTKKNIKQCLQKNIGVHQFWKMLESNPDPDVVYFQKNSSSEQLATI